MIFPLAAYPGDISELCVTPLATLREVITLIDHTGMQIAFVVDDHKRFLGTITDGDVRRSLLRGGDLSALARDVMTADAITANPDLSLNEDSWLLHKRLARRIPIVNASGTVIGLAIPQDEIVPQGIPNQVVLMAGGLGTRLGKLTEDTPKPLLKVGSKPILETILENFIEQGFKHFNISVNYKAQMIEDYFGDGSSWGAEIRYIRETTRLGTAGALSLLETPPTGPVFVMNGDLLTKVNFRQMLEFHQVHRQRASVAVRRYDVQVPFGVVEMRGSSISGIVEKPQLNHFVSAGIYLLDPECLSLIPYNTFYDMPDLLKATLEQNWRVGSFPVHEYWLDIGRLDDFEAANLAYAEIFQ